tara:strand:+ start:139 stop:942 length:804 start_codon:yes stop_codon:yes gene_type:complete
MKYLYIAISSITLAYCIIIFFTYFYQRNLLYHPDENNYANDEIKFNYEEVFIDIDKDIKLRSWFINKDLKNNKTILFFHGNAGSLINRVHKLNELEKLDINILIISWRGFSKNLGKPTEKNLYNDARKSLEWLNSKGVENNKIVLYGESLGTGVATELGQDNSFAGIILESPFTSIADTAKIYYPYLPINLLLKDRYDSIKKIKNINIPVLIMHGKKDDIVPFVMGQEIFDKANNPKMSYFSENDDHMMEFNDQLINSLKKFLGLNP